MPFPGIIAGRVLNSAAPVNLAHPLNRGLVAAYSALPAAAGASGWGSTLLRDLLGKYPATLTNGPTWAGSRGRPGGYGSLSFDGTNDYVVSGAASLPLPVTMTCWFRPTSAAVFHVLNSHDGGDNHGYRIELTSAGAVSLAFGGVAVYALTGLSYAANEWAFFAVSITGNGGMATGYVGGSSGFTASSPVAVGTPSAPMNVLRFGARGDGAVAASGLADDVRWYNRAVGADEVRALYDQSRRGHPETLNWMTGRAHMASSPAAGGGNRRRRLLIGA